MDFNDQIKYLVIGWLLGLFSPLIVDFIRVQRRKRETRRALLVELTGLRSKLARLVYSIKNHLGELDRELLEWTHSTVKSSRLTEQDDEFLATLRPLLNAPDEHLRSVSEEIHEATGESLSYSEYDLPFIESQMAFIAILSPTQQQQLLEIRNSIGAINQRIRDGREFMKATFDTSLTTDLLVKLTQNLKVIDRDIVLHARSLTDLIGKVDLGYKS